MTIDPNVDGQIQFSQYAFDDDGDTITVEDVFLRSIDSVLQSGAARYPGWLDYTTAEEDLADGRKRLSIDFDINASMLEAGTEYELEIQVSDATHPVVSGIFTLTTAPAA